MSRQEVESVFNIRSGLTQMQSVQDKFILDGIFRYESYLARTLSLQVQLQVAPQEPSKLNYVLLCLDGSIIKMLFTDI